MTGYPHVPSDVQLPRLDTDILEFWRRERIFQASVAQNRDAPTWTFFEGPPTANGKPGVHHLEARTFKDVFPRYRSMRGWRVSRKGGWDCHGLPVELAVEKELGLQSKDEIESYGVARFNERCRESVLRYVDLWKQMTERMGCWLDMRDPYHTMDASYIESVWWALQQIHRAGLLVQDDRVTPYCPRCETGLSDHELAQGYETTTDLSVYVRLPLTSGPLAGRASLLVWTTTPWTLVANALVAVAPQVPYGEYTDGEEHVVVAEPRAQEVLGPGWRLVGPTWPGTEMVGWRYDRPVDLLPQPTSPAHFVVAEDYVGADEGTGLVHQAPAFGEEDLASCRRHGVDVVNPIDASGNFSSSLPLLGSLFFRDAEGPLVERLRETQTLFRAQPVQHEYPHCWRCHTPLMYYARPSWYIRTTVIRDQLLRENSTTSWFPRTIGGGRYGNWLRKNIDWALSRDRYWGTPLPIWRCAEAHDTVVGSLAELSSAAGRDVSGLDPHRPYVDEITITCPVCGGPATRVPEVIDAWFDSGSMPFAQWGYPWASGSSRKFDRAYPADFICEAIDQTRGWFYTLMVIGTLLFDRSAYRDVLCLGHILAEDGRKMSKHLGNTLEPIPLMDEYGADAVRWFMCAAGSPWGARRVGGRAIQESARRVLMTYWNTVSFQTLYGRAASWSPRSDRPSGRHVMDRWLRAVVAQTTMEVTAAFERYDTQRVGELLAALIDDLSNWYVRRSRSRFWSGEPHALQTLHEARVTLTQLMSPVTPFISEAVWQQLVRSTDPTAPRSVHLSRWPAPRDDEDVDLIADMRSARRVVDLGRVVRARHHLRTRQPLGRALISSSVFEALSEELRVEIAEELNVQELAALGSHSDLVVPEVKPSYRALGRRHGRNTPAVAQAIREADPRTLMVELRDRGRAVVDVDGAPVQLLADEVVVTEGQLAGWGVLSQDDLTVALDLQLDERLVRGGLQRDLVRAIQDARKDRGLAVTDRIWLRWAGHGPLADVLRDQQADISAEILAEMVTESATLPAGKPGRLDGAGTVEFVVEPIRRERAR